MQGYRIREGNNISSLAFADDLILTANYQPQAHELLKYTETYLKKLGMALSAPKCVCCDITPTHDSWHIANPHINFDNGDEMPYADAGVQLKYLGIEISP